MNSPGAVDSGSVNGKRRQLTRMTQVEAAQLLGRHKSWVCRRLALLEKLSVAVTEDLRLGLVGPSLARQLAAIHSLAQFIGLRSPEHLSWCSDLRTIQSKRALRPLITYLEKDEMDALLAAPNQNSDQGQRDSAVLLFLYNTGARADEVAHVRIGDLDLAKVPTRDLSSVLIHGKGNKPRRCPLWTRTIKELLPLVQGRIPSEHVFLNRRRQPITRFGIHALVERYAADVTETRPSLAKKRVSPHVIRHTTATHLLRSGVDINTIRAWLGHVSLTTTNIYAEVDLEMKAKALATCDVGDNAPTKPWRGDKGLMDFLRAL